MSDFTGKAIIVTGSSQGIGRALARYLARRGANVLLNARNPEKLAETADALAAEGLGVELVAGDVTDPVVCERLVSRCTEKFGRLDALVNNAGMSQRALFAETDLAAFHQIMDINVMGSIGPTKSALRELSRYGGSVVFISSLAGIHGLPGAAAYCASKMALTAIAESLRPELKKLGVHVGVVYVGFTQNDPEKRILTAGGEVVPIQHAVKPHSSQERVAKKIAQVISRRRFKTVLTPTGLGLRAVQRIAPGILDLAFAATLERTKSMLK